MASKFFLVFVIVLSLKYASSTNFNCNSGKLNENSVSLVTLTTKDEHDQWVTTFTAQRDSTYTKDGLIVDMKHSVVQCDDKQTIQVHGVVKASNVGSAISSKRIQPNTLCKDKLRFHLRKGDNAELTNDGRTAFRKPGTTNYAGVLTNRMLKSNEMFEIVLEELMREGSSFGFGLSKLPATQYPFTDWMKSGWILYDNHVYVDGYGNISYPLNIGALKVGDRIGVLRKDNGDVHFYINGIDKGVAVSGVPSTVYGAFDMYAKGARASIVDNCN